MTLLDRPIQPDFESFRRCVTRQGAPGRVHFVELYQDGPIKRALIERFGVGDDLDRNAPCFDLRRDIALQRFLGYELIRVHAPESEFRVDFDWKPKPGGETRKTIQGFTVHEHAGPVQTWEDLEGYPWPTVDRIDARPFEWMERHFPDDMRAFDLAMQVFEATNWLMGYESLFLNILEDPDLVRALIDRIGECALDYVRFLCGFRFIGVIWGCDDMGFKSQTMVSPDWLREMILPWHKRAAAIAHEHGKLYFLHSCGNVDALMDSLIDDVGIDAKHSFEDAITPVAEFHRRYGDRVAVLGGLDVDFLCRASAEDVRRRVRETLSACPPSTGYCLGTGNSVTAYMSVENYLAMLDEGRRWPL